MAYGTINTDLITNSNGLSGNAIGPGFKNKIINGAMMIDQRNNGASGTAVAYTVDRWQFNASLSTKGTWQQNAGSVTPPTGFTNYLGFTSNSAYSVPSGELFSFQQRIEGLNCADLAWGTANAKTVTLSFWVRSSLTGTFGGSLRNGGGDRSYPFTYTISSANTWEQKSITIAGDTTGTWLTTTGIGIIVTFSLGTGTTYSGTAGAWTGSNLTSATGATSVVGTNGATLYITGVQLEVGSTATSFDYRPYGTELALCQRYYYRLYPETAGIVLAQGYTQTTAGTVGSLSFPVEMRVAPTSLDQVGTANRYSVNDTYSSITCSSVPSLNANWTTTRTGGLNFTVASGLTANRPASLRTDATNGATAYLGWSAEL